MTPEHRRIPTAWEKPTIQVSCDADPPGLGTTVSLLDSNAGRRIAVSTRGPLESEPAGERTPCGDESDLGFLDRELDAFFEHTYARFEPGTELRARAAQRVAAHGRRAEPRQDALLRLTEGIPAGPLVVMTFNGGHGALFENWYASCRVHRIEVRARSLVIALDTEARKLAQRLGFRCYFDPDSYGRVSSRSAEAFGDSHFRSLMFAKCAVVFDALHLGRDILFQDVDMVWQRDPLPDLEDRAGAGGFDEQFMYDGPNRRYAPLYLNSGFFNVRNSQRAALLWSAVLRHFDKVLQSGSHQLVVNSAASLLQDRGRKIGRLPEARYLNGHEIHAASSQRRSRFLIDDADVIHVSWTLNLKSKLEKLRDNHLWFVGV